MAGDLNFFDESEDPYDYVPDASELPLANPGDFLPVLSDTPQSSNDSPYSGYGDKLGSIGATAARLGTAVGTIQRDIANATHNYKTAQNNARTGNSLGTFWMYASPTDKAMILLAVAAIAVTLLKD